jgi:hypothetical protein
MSDLKLAELILAHVQAGGRVTDVLKRLAPVMTEGERYDMAFCGPFAMPWVHDSLFRLLYEQAETIERGAWTGFGVDSRAYILAKMAELALQSPVGDFVECGVFRGGTALLAATVFQNAGAVGKFHLFDTFAGVPEENLTDAERNARIAGNFDDVSVEETQRNLAKFADFLSFHPGYVPDTFVDAGIDKVRYAHIDINTGVATRACLEYLVPRLVDGGVIVLDDYGWPAYVDCKQVTDEYFAEQALPGPIPLHTGQAIYIHRANAERHLNF